MAREVTAVRTADTPNLLYRTLRWLSRWAVRWILRDVTTTGDGAVPARGPALLVINHPNELCDILLTFATTPRPIHFVGAIAHAASPVVAAALRAIGAIFVYRAHERAGAAVDGDAANRAALDQMVRVLQQGGIVAIFPEGGVRRDVPIGRLQPGAAALALRAVREGELPALPIVPIGIAYDAPDRVRCRAAVTIGAPLEVTDWDRATHPTADRATAPRRPEIATLLAAIAERLGAAATHSRAVLAAPSEIQWSRGRLWLTAPVALWGALTHAVLFAVVVALGRATMTDPTERLGRLAVPGVIPALGWYALLWVGAAIAVRREIAPLWLAVLLALTLPYAAWATLRWADAWRARSASE